MQGFCVFMAHNPLDALAPIPAFPQRGKEQEFACKRRAPAMPHDPKLPLQ